MMHLVQVMDATVFPLDLVVCKSFSLINNICFIKHYSDFVRMLLLSFTALSKFVGLIHCTFSAFSIFYKTFKCEV